MGPKKNVNSKAVAALEKKEQAKQKADSQKAKAVDDADWAAAGEGAKSKAQAKKEEQNKQREEAAAKKAEAKRLAAEEEASIAATKPAKAKTAATKVTSHQLRLQKDAELRELEKEAALRKRDQKREVTEDTYDQLVATPNKNKETEGVDARSVQEALEALNVSQAEEDRHPEKRAKAAFEAFQERELPVLKEDKPGLKQSQYKDMLWKAWQKAPDNPFNKPKQ